MGLTQTQINRMGTQTRIAMGEKYEQVTYTYRATQGSTGTAYTPYASFRQFTERQLSALDDVLQNDMQVRIPTGELSITPTRWDTITRSDTTVWQLISPSGGAGYTHWIFQGRQIG